ncbi:molybdate ABC transporter substrate-binding protein [Maritimibacter sp. UBA3975]|uniref:molybdate ABC transporter substrate-binding protein n=1 Tax=Maritimibacter sp. UBA3975 TaxID=1946833 RepID=UPI000C0AACBE|nr:molybdate ABC transporter substrate-binding protein [Maritimibacter sp. UBA3975]MAM63327.1 molybdate ABC transporter substrate-binding protein [Maritimibacter sp.]|tara:strand:- start:18887 stop:19645 length:759 start_codon:yes stop_codon:yes gene_type:complete
MRRLPLFLTALLTLLPLTAGAGQITVFAAASLGEVLEDVSAEFEAATGHDVVLSFAGSSVLARQIAQGAPADLFISANRAWIDNLIENGAIDPDSEVEVLRNDLVLIAPGRPKPITLGPDTDLAAQLGDGVLAMALVEAVPAGIYGKAALEALALWPQVASRVAQADNVRAALALVATGEAPLGIVYATDARAEPRVGVLATFPADSHPPIVYPAAATTSSGNPVNQEFLAFLTGPEARAIFTAAGFGVIPE